jgi:hypothetical protein
MTDSDDDRDRLDPREDARAKRRDRDADAQRRDLMRPGMGKVFSRSRTPRRRPRTNP